MKMVIQKMGSFVLAICFSLSVFLWMVSPINADSSSTSEKADADLSSCRKIYKTEDNMGYTSTQETSLPYEYPLSVLSVGSSNPDGIQIDFDSPKGVPVVQIENVANLQINIGFANKKQNDVVYEWSTSKRKEKTNFQEKYTLSYDSWGATQTGNKKQTVFANGEKLTTGEIGTGALVVQTSDNGTSWVNNDKDKFAKGMYTTDVLKHYHGTTQTYTIDGNSIKKGVYVSISLFYEIKMEAKYYYTTQDWYWYQRLLFGIPIGASHTVEHTADREPSFLNICEQYVFFVIEDNPEGATFNNLTTHDDSEIIEVARPSSNDPEEYAIQAEQYNRYITSVLDNVLPTMNDGDMTTTGFRINVTSNPYLKVSLKRNGVSCALPVLTNKNSQWYYQITSPGRYDITISSYSRSRSITLYVDNVSGNVAYQRYFGKSVVYDGQQYGDEFLDYSPDNPYGNLRVFDANSNIPVFAGSLTLKLKETDSNMLPLYGMIVNRSTGKTTPVVSKTVTLEEFGEYEVLFYTNKDYYNYAVLGKDLKIAGDVRVYTFHFKLIGTSKGAIVNQQLLSSRSYNGFSIASPSDYYPKFYGVSRTTADKGRVVVAFADEMSALQYAMSVVVGDIERKEDEQNGRVYWLIPNPDNPMQKIRSDSGWDNARLIKEVSAKMVDSYFFDSTDSSSYLTLDKTVMEYQTENGDISQINLATLQLTQTVVIWYDSLQRTNATVKCNSVQPDVAHVLTYIGQSKFSALEEKDGTYSVTEGIWDYHFIKDALGIDSNQITAVDSKNNSFSLNYQEGLFEQLMNCDCAPGYVRIIEETVYGISSEYYVCFIPKGYQTAELSVDCGEGNTFVSGETYQICQITDVFNLTDPCSFVQVYYKSGGNAKNFYYSLDDIKDVVFDDCGSYIISVIDRFGNSREFTFVIH